MISFQRKGFLPSRSVIRRFQSVSFSLAHSLTASCFRVNIILGITYKYVIRCKQISMVPVASCLSLDLLYKLLSRKREMRNCMDISVISSILCKIVLIQRTRWIFTLVYLLSQRISESEKESLTLSRSRRECYFSLDVNNCKSTNVFLKIFNIFNGKLFLSSY